MQINGVDRTSVYDLAANSGNPYGKMVAESLSAKQQAESTAFDRDMNDSERSFYVSTGINPFANTASREKYADWILSEKSANSAREWTAKREDTQYQRLVSDLRAAGINPGILAQSGASPVSSSSQGVNYQGSEMTSARNTNKNTGTQILTRLLAASSLLLLKMI